MSNDTTPEANTESSRKTGRIIAIVAVVVVVAALIANAMRGTKTADTVVEQLPAGCKPGFLFSETDGKPCPQPAGPIDAAAATPTTAPGGYEEAIRLYGGKVVIFDAACKSLPAAPSFALGTRILIANNSTKALTLAVADKSEKLDPYHYYTASLKTPGNVVVSCEGKPAATIIVK